MSDSQVAHQDSSGRLLNSGSMTDKTEPNACGSHIDKLCLIPFFAVVAFLGYYGVQGASEFNLYNAGEAKAQALCSPLADLEEQCKSDLSHDIKKAGDAVKGKAIVELHKGTGTVVSLQDSVSGACEKLAGGVDKCHAIDEASQKFLKLPELPALPAVGADIGSAAKAIQSKATEFTGAITSICSEGSKHLDSLCSKLDATMGSVATKVDDTLSKLADDAPKRVEEALLKSLTETSGVVCPALEGVPKSCASVKQSLQDALSKAGNAAVDTLPAQIPHEIFDAALNKARDIALGYVDGLCNETTNVAKDCPKFFGKPTWQPLLTKLNDPLVALKSKLKDATEIIKHKTGAQCRNVSSVLEASCKHVSTTIDTAVASTSELGKLSAEQLGKMRASLVAQLKTARSTLGSSITQVSASVDALVGGCQNLGNTLKSQCQAVKSAGQQFSSSTKQVEGSLQHISDAGNQVEANCKKLGELHESCLVAANPFAIVAKGVTGLWQHRAAEIVRLEMYLLIGCSITVLIMLVIIKVHTKLIVTISVFLNLSAVLGTAVINLMVWNLPGAILFGSLFLLKALWFWCIWSRFEFAVALIHCGVQSVEKFIGIGAWILGLVLIIIQVGFVVLTGGAWYKLLGASPPPEIQELIAVAPGLLPVLLVFAMVWTIEVTANVLHVTICCSLGSKCGVNTPAKSTCGSFCFAVTGALGSISAGSFLIALLKALQYALEKGQKSNNPCVKIIVSAACCLLEWILKLFNSYAFVFVGLKGMSYYKAAEKTAEVFAKDGMGAMAADEALHDVIRVAKMVALWVSVLIALFYGHALGLVGLTMASWQEVLMGPLLCLALAGGTSYALTLVMGRLLEAAVCTLFIIFEEEDYKKGLEDADPEIYKLLSEHASTQKQGAE